MEMPKMSDDACRRYNGRPTAQLHFHKKVTSNNSQYQGVHPLVSLQSHQESLAILIRDAIQSLPSRHGKPLLEKENQPGDTDIATKRLPDFISVTRGPGMRSNLFTGLDTAKGLAVAWQIPLVAVHHMQAHALTPRMVSALESQTDPTSNETAMQAPTNADLVPDFPFLSVLASGGHTLLIHSASLTEHRVLGSTNDIAIGECLDKIARVVLPSELLQTTKSTMYGALLEAFAFPTQSQEQPPQAASKQSVHSAETYLDAHGRQYEWYEVPANHEEAMRKSITKWGWALNKPLTKAGGGIKINSLEMSFSGITTMVERIVRYGMDPVTKKFNKAERTAADISVEERMDLARETMRAAFEHVASRVVLGLQSRHDVTPAKPAVVMAGGVAANSLLRHILAETLCAHGFPDVKLYFPPPKFCTDNAAMIGWTGLEMFEAGHTDPLDIRAIRKWPLDQLLDPPADG
ncbi:glycoprotease family protein [Stemphylium lycopersici]|uniref:N(6)-L-threonylcarbamoyladenine synthase n=1 Tax=Stemphylium lycopersici TaxID=183478 RepID=A0A364NEY6_STELY|nr:glycoprotease family protein [Stemphylium lycopersici]RAR10931.1 glycoprotease family protein [Stemphylium lycopersici]RAR15673.1 glycoprotease family protein [Stemphylium lycopersici]